MLTPVAKATAKVINAGITGVVIVSKDIQKAHETGMALRPHYRKIREIKVDMFCFKQDIIIQGYLQEADQELAKYQEQLDKLQQQYKIGDAQT